MQARQPGTHGTNRRRKVILYQVAPNFPVEELYIGPFKIPLEGKNKTPQTGYDPLKHFNDPMLMQAIISKNLDVSLAALAEDPNNPFYESLRTWFVFILSYIHFYRIYVVFCLITIL